MALREAGRRPSSCSHSRAALLLFCATNLPTYLPTQRAPPLAIARPHLSLKRHYISLRSPGYRAAPHRRVKEPTHRRRSHVAAGDNHQRAAAHGSTPGSIRAATDCCSEKERENPPRRGRAVRACCREYRKITFIPSRTGIRLLTLVVLL